MDVLYHIQKEYENLSSTQKRIADFIISHPDQACFLSLKRLSNQVETTEVTIMNFVRKIGYDSFVEFKRDLEGFIMQKISPYEKMANVLSSTENEDEHINNIINMDIEGFINTVKNLDSQDIKTAVKMITEANKIYLLGLGISQTIMTFLLLRFKIIGVEAESFEMSLYNDIFSLQISKLKPGDVFIVASFPTYSKHVIRLSQYLNEKGIDLIVLTDKPTAPLAKYAKITFCCAVETPVFYNSMTVPMAVVNALVSTLALEMKNKLIENSESIKEVEKIFFKEGF